MLKLISNTCQNLLIIVGILHGLSKCLDYKDNALGANFLMILMAILEPF